eukprot:scaffold68115_cov70-Attheya_sp.AAC.1
MIHEHYLISRRFMKQAEKHNLLSDEQYGGQKGRSAIDVVMLMELTLGIFHLQCSNGAITCYDHIIALLVALTYSKAGLPDHLCVLFA